MKPTEGEINLIANRKLETISAAHIVEHISTLLHGRKEKKMSNPPSLQHNKSKLLTESKMLNLPSWLEEYKQLEAQIETVEPPSSSSS